MPLFPSPQARLAKKRLLTGSICTNIFSVSVPAQFTGRSSRRLHQKGPCTGNPGEDRPPVDCPTIVTATPRSWKAGLYRAFCHLLVAPSLPLPHVRAHHCSPLRPLQVPTPLTFSGLSSHRCLTLQAGPFPGLILLGPHLLWGDKLNYAKY